jgi:BMFP domain-containing protein YqiC
MFDPNALNDLAKRLAEAMPADFSALKGDMERNFQAILQASFSRMNLVSREEFDVQSAVLARTRATLEGLEARVAELEKQLPDRP